MADEDGGVRPGGLGDENRQKEIVHSSKK